MQNFVFHSIWGWITAQQTNYLKPTMVKLTACFHEFFEPESTNFFYQLCISMTTLLTHTVAHSTKPSFMPKTNNKPPKKCLIYIYTPSCFLRLSQKIVKSLSWFEFYWEITLNLCALLRNSEL